MYGPEYRYMERGNFSTFNSSESGNFRFHFLFTGTQSKKAPMTEAAGFHNRFS